MPNFNTVCVPGGVQPPTGFGESFDADAAKLGRELAAVIEETGLGVSGPNCMGNVCANTSSCTTLGEPCSGSASCCSLTCLGGHCSFYNYCRAGGDIWHG